jgi:hypothetical protein
VSACARLASREPKRDPIYHLIEATPTPIDVYGVCRGSCGIIAFDSSHNYERCRRHYPYSANTTTTIDLRL